MEEIQTKIKTTMTPQEAAEHSVHEKVRNDDACMFASEEDLLLYDHFFRNGMQHQSEQHNQALSSALKEIAELHAKVRFKKPTPDEVCQFALLFQTESGGKPIDRELLVEMVGFAFMVIDRLYENGDITKPSSKELKNSYRLSPESNSEPDSANLPPESAP